MLFLDIYSSTQPSKGRHISHQLLDGQILLQVFELHVGGKFMASYTNTKWFPEVLF